MRIIQVFDEEVCTSGHLVPSLHEENHRPPVTPSEICSNQGTNFRGANKELKEAFAAMEPQLQKSAAPHFGGVWERKICLSSEP